jgi:hypothetical protein
MQMVEIIRGWLATQQWYDRAFGVYEIDPDIANEASAALARFACFDDERPDRCGRTKGDPVFEKVTEGRQKTWIDKNNKLHNYSGCADLAQFVLWYLAGKPDPDDHDTGFAFGFVNRADAFGWRVGMNVAQLGLAQFKTVYKSGMPFAGARGHVLLIGENGQEHIAIIDQKRDNELLTFDYGQFFQPSPKSKADAGGKPCKRVLYTGKDGRPWLLQDRMPGRPVVWTINTGLLLNHASLRCPTLPAFLPSTFEGAVQTDNPYLGDF